MNVDEKDLTLLKRLPGIDHIMELLEKDDFFLNIPRSVRLQCARKTVAGLRADIISGQKRISEADLADEGILHRVRNSAHETMTPRLVRTINATGVVLHTN
ncbi:MAG: L-seryl-tRNA(Sec) selenium transferase, partial [Desulfobacterales bacterium]|nr:L-seryl-tRNA(Sec) selenium transferase [Desulfobacterales bacterium]